MSESDLNSETHEENSGNFYTGTEPFLAVFTHTQVVLSGIRLVHDGKITHQVSDLGAQIENVRRNFIHSGDIVSVLQDIGRIVASFGQRVQGWEAEANRRLRGKSELSGGALAKIKTELSNVRTKIRLGARSLTKLEVELHQLAGKLAAGSDDFTDALAGESASVEEVIDDAPPALTLEQEENAIKGAAIVDKFLQAIVEPSLVVAIENANRLCVINPEHVEQVWEAEKNIPGQPSFVFASGWTTKIPSGDSSESGTGRRKLDLSFWVLPKSLEASKTLEFLSDRNAIWIESRKLDSTRVGFDVAEEAEFPISDLLSGFLKKFNQRYGVVPNLLVAKLGNLEWIQKSVVVKCA